MFKKSSLVATVVLFNLVSAFPVLAEEPVGGVSTVAPESSSISSDSGTRLNLIGGAAISKNVTSVVYDTAIRRESSTGFLGGATVDIGKSAMVFETGLIYRQMENSIKEGSGNSLYGSERNFGYLSSPILGKYFLSGESGRGFFVRGGLAPALLISKSQTVISAGRREELQSDEMLETRRFDVLVNFGLGANIHLSEKTSLVLGAEYVRGLMDFSLRPDSDYNQAYGLTAGLALAL